ncbi:helix-turn-helix domain-containing protein [Streptomyces sp. NPDC014892]|uniref:helix-turn-helix domain-containing protein n=1 Tax=unclassified Streptomyces TaxID=2593676 RepID=UPI0033B333E1
MPDEQQPDDEQRVAEYGTAATRDHNRRMLSARRLEVDETAAGKLRAAVSDAIEQYEADREAERRQYEAAQGTGLDTLANGFREATSTAKRHDLAEQVGRSLPLAEAGIIRRAAKAVEDALPGTVVDARVDGWSAKEIAAELNVTPSYVYRILKDNPWEADWIMYRAAGDGVWEPVESGIVEATTETAAKLADEILGENLDVALARSGARVCVWRSGDGDDPNDARGTAQRGGDTPLSH